MKTPDQIINEINGVLKASATAHRRTLELLRDLAEVVGRLDPKRDATADLDPDSN